MTDKVTAYYHRVIGLGAAVGLLSILLMIETGGLVWTCCILRKTTEIRYIRSVVVNVEIMTKTCTVSHHAQGKIVP